MYPPLCEEELEVQSYTSPRRGVNIPHTAQARPKGLGCMGRCFGRNWRLNHTRPYHPNGPRRIGGAWVSPRLCGEQLQVQSYPTPPPVRPYPPSGRGRTGGTRVYLPLCGEELKDQLYPARQGSVPIPQTAHAGPEGLGCLRRCVGRS